MEKLWEPGPALGLYFGVLCHGAARGWLRDGLCEEIGPGQGAQWELSAVKAPLRPSTRRGLEPHVAASLPRTRELYAPPYWVGAEGTSPLQGHSAQQD